MSAAHPGRLELRRLSLGELPEPAAQEARAHLEGCARCQQTLQEHREEQRRFEEAVPFERFRAGVEKAARRPSAKRSPRALVTPALALAASILVVLSVQPLLSSRRPVAGVRLKGGADVELRIAGPDGSPQRVAAAQAPEALQPGERVRIGYQAGSHRFVAAVSVDAQGEVTPLYPEAGPGLAAEAGESLRYLPRSLEFTGHGLERIIVLLSDEPYDMQLLLGAARDAYARAGGDVLHLPPLALAGEQFHRTVLKP